MRPTKRVWYANIINVLNEIDSDLSNLSDLTNSDDEEEDETPPKVQNQSDDAETLSESVDEEGALTNGTATSNPKVLRLI